MQVSRALHEGWVLWTSALAWLHVAQSSLPQGHLHRLGKQFGLVISDLGRELLFCGMTVKNPIRAFWQGLDNVRSLQLFQLFRYGGLILTNILLAKSTLSLAEIGVFETLMFLASGITFFWVSGLTRGMLSAYPSLADADKKSLFFSIFILFQGISLLVTLFYWIFQDGVLWLVTDFTELPYFHLLCIYMLLNIPAYLVEYFYLLTHQPKRIVQFGAFAFTAHVLAVALPVFLGYSLEVSFYCLILKAAIKYLWLLIVLYKNAIPAYRSDLVTPFLVLSLPLVFNVLVAGGAEYIDGVIIQRYFDKQTFAIFRYGAKELPLALALTGAFSAALIPSIATNLQEGLQTILKKSRRLMHLLFLVSIVLMLSSPYLFPLVFSEEFAASAGIFNIYLLILISRVWFPQTILIGLKQTGIILGISFFELVANVGLSLLFVQYWGIHGIAFATVIAYVVDKVLLAFYLYWKEGIAPRQYIDLKLFTTYSILLSISYYLAM